MFPPAHKLTTFLAFLFFLLPGSHAQTLNLDAIDSQSVLAGSPLHIPLVASDNVGETITFTATSDQAALSPVIITRSKSLVIDVKTHGTMIFALFGNRVSRPANRVVELADSGFYDGIKFHRILNKPNVSTQLIQFGNKEYDNPSIGIPPGSGGSTLGEFADQFHFDLQHNRAGVLSFAKAIDDSNDSQLFILQMPQREYDFNHSVVGLLVKGYNVLESIHDEPTPRTTDFPYQDVVILSARTFDDNQNGVLMLKANDGFSGSARVTVTATSSSGAVLSRSFDVQVAPDTKNSQGFIDDIPPVETFVDQSTSIELASYFRDLKGRAAVKFCNMDFLSRKFPEYASRFSSNPDLDYSLDETTGHLTISPKNGLSGVHSLSVCHWYGVVANGDEGMPVWLDIQSFDVVINQPPPNNPPTIDGLSEQTCVEETQLRFKVNGLDLDADDTLTYSMTPTPAGASLDSATGEFTWTPDDLQEGDYDISFTVDDGEDSVSQTIRIEVIPKNHPPQIDSLTSKAGMETSLLEFWVDGTDEDGDTLSYAMFNAPLGASLNAGDGKFSWTPDDTQEGTYNITFSVSDGELTTSQSINVAIANFVPPPPPVNDPPSINGLTNKSGIEESLLQFAVDASDPENDTLTYTMNPIPAGAGLNSSSGQFSWTPNDTQAGTYNIEFSVSDGEHTTSQSIVITIADINPPPVNRPPTIIGLTNKSVEAQSILQFSANGSDPDLDDILTYSMDVVLAGASLNSASGLFSWVPDDNQVGTHQVEFSVSDGEYTTAQSIEIEILPRSNNAPTISGLTDRTFFGGGYHLLVVVGEDLDGDVLTYSINNAPAGAGINSETGQLLWRPDNSQAGTHDIEFSVDDGIDITSKTITITVVPNNPPSLDTLTDKSGIAGSPLTFTVVGTDLDGDTLIYSLLPSSPPGTLIHRSTGEFSWTPTPSQVGTFEVWFLAQDGRYGNTKKMIYINISPPNNPPTISGPLTVNGLEGDLIQFQMQGSDSDPGDTLTYSMANAPAGASLNSSDGTFTWTPSLTQAGIYDVNFTVSDGEDEASQVVRITVADVPPPNRPPQIIGLTNKSGIEGTELRFTVNAIDPDVDDGPTLSFSMDGNLPVEASLDSHSGVFTWTPNNSQSGIYSASFSVSDGEDSVHHSIQITIQDFIPTDNPPQAAMQCELGICSVQFGEPLVMENLSTDPEGAADIANVTWASRPASLVDSPYWTQQHCSETCDFYLSGHEMYPNFSAGTYDIKLFVTDRAGNTSEAVSQITIIDPSADSGPTALISCDPVNCNAESGQELTLFNYTSDPDGAGDIRESRWYIRRDTDSVWEHPKQCADLCDYKPTEDYPEGSYRARLEVEDLSGKQHHAEVNFIIRDGEDLVDPIELDEIGSIIVREGEHAGFRATVFGEMIVSIIGTVSSLDGLVLAEVDNLPPGAFFDSHSGFLSWPTELGQAGEYLVTLTVRYLDSSSSDSETVRITVVEDTALAAYSAKLTDLDDRELPKDRLGRYITIKGTELKIKGYAKDQRVFHPFSNVRGIHAAYLDLNYSAADLIDFDSPFIVLEEFPELRSGNVLNSQRRVEAVGGSAVQLKIGSRALFEGTFSAITPGVEHIRLQAPEVLDGSHDTLLFVRDQESMRLEESQIFYDRIPPLVITDPAASAPIVSGELSPQFGGLKDNRSIDDTFILASSPGVQAVLANIQAITPEGKPLMLSLNGASSAQFNTLTGDFSFVPNGSAGVGIYDFDFTISSGPETQSVTFYTLPGDLDYDGCVTLFDLSIFAAHYDAEVIGVENPIEYGDFDLSGKTDLFDLSWFAASYQQCIPGAAL